ncbi:MAG TPA: 2-phospho-L-lactate guanylyltransferase [Solirubrobacteraceae bacterium]|nr:2-phospho-L-lactate guanylyltransferase [Solirubrobacteraceae bacterium]
MRTAAILPVKRFAAAKSRLGASGVADELRARLARAMVADVLDALAGAERIEHTIVVTNEQSVHDAVLAHGATLVADAADAGQSAAVAHGVARALGDGFERALCIPGDCPTLDAAELDELLAAADARAAAAEVVIVPDRHGTGTNGLLLTPPNAIASSFGPASCKRHRALALAAGARCEVERPSSLLLDVDTGDDLAALRDRLDTTRAAASRTRAVLGQPELRDRLSVIEAD